jgi:hypothetical protein
MLGVAMDVFALRHHLPTLITALGTTTIFAYIIRDACMTQGQENVTGQ